MGLLSILLPMFPSVDNTPGTRLILVSMFHPWTAFQYCGCPQQDIGEHRKYKLLLRSPLQHLKGSMN